MFPLWQTPVVQKMRTPELDSDSLMTLPITNTCSHVVVCVAFLGKLTFDYFNDLTE